MPAIAKQTAKLTQRYAEQTKFPPGVEQMVFDVELKGFALRVFPSGSRKWVLRVNNIKHTLGPISELNEKDARLKAIEIKQGFRSGRNPIREAKAAEKEAEIQRVQGSITAGYAFTKFIKSPEAFSGRTSKHRLSQIKLLTDHVLANKAVMALPLPDLGYTEMMKVLASIPEYQWSRRNHLINAIRQAYKFFRKDLDEIVLAFGHLPTPSFEELRGAPKEKHDRLLPEELQHIYEAAERIAEQNIWHSGFFRMVILTCRRTNTVRSMRWDDLTLGPNDGPPYWRIPASFNKKGRGSGDGLPQSLPLSDRMISVLDEMPREGEYVFGGKAIRIAEGGKPLSKLREWSGIEYDRDGNPWTLHGIRRSMASSSLGATHKFLVDFIQGRRPNKQSDPNYFQGDYLEEQLDVLHRWDEIIWPKNPSSNRQKTTPPRELNFRGEEIELEVTKRWAARMQAKRAARQKKPPKANKS